VLTFEFAALEYSAPAKNRYAYRMLGFSDAWIESGSVRAAYTNLPPGDYVFQVRASNNDGVWNEQGASLAILITPPWWRTWWAYALYAALVLAALYGARRYELNRLRLKNRLQVEQLEGAQLRELDHARSRLFANVSHEFRTPLTLTMGPLDDLRAGLHGPLSPAAAEQVDLARRNAGRVLDLINEILELARAESGRETVHARRVDLGAFVGSVARTFGPLAERKAIAYDIQCPPGEVMVYADPDHLDRALSNLLSNAFKFTLDGGTVRVTVGGDETSARITVRDSGPGIAAADLGLIFDRFHRARTAVTQPGTGIGLALAKELIALHGGTITVDSEEGFGSTFVIHARKARASGARARGRGRAGHRVGLTARPTTEFWRRRRPCETCLALAPARKRRPRTSRRCSWWTITPRCARTSAASRPAVPGARGGERRGGDRDGATPPA
jgi:signal transduction histidine kinase